MRLKHTLLLMALLSPLYGAAQSGMKPFTVKGTVADSLTREGEPYATVSIASHAAPSKAVKMMATNIKGNFRASVPGRGRFVLTVSSMGRKNIVKDITVSAEQQTIDLDTLFISDAGNELRGVEIVSQKRLVKADIDKIEYSIEDDPDSKSSTVLEMLRKVPMVTVDGEDNIKVNGNSSFKVYVNGKPNKMMSDNPADVLKSLPANSIKRIEVITNPGPKYDAEGVGGILNIITVGSGLEGYTVTINASANSRGTGGGLFGTVKKGKLTVSGRYNYNYNNSPRSHSGGTRVTTGAIATSSSDLEYHSTGKGHSDRQSGSIEASYDIDTLRLVTMSFGLWGGSNNNDSESGTLATMPADGSELYRFATTGNSKRSWYSINGGLDYQRLFSVKDRMFTLSYRLNTRPDNSDSYSDYNDMNAVTDWQDFLRRMTDQHNDGAQSTTEQTLQADYTTPIGKLHTVETGIKYILRDNKSENDRYAREAGTSGDYVFDSDHSSHYSHRNDIIAAYLGYGLKWEKLSARLGLRYEHTIQDVEYRLGRGDDFRKDFDDMVPSASVGLKLTEMSNIRVGYNMRIYRPGIWYLNPYLNDENPTSISQGNPNVESEKNHSFNLTYGNFANKLNVNLSARYSFTNNSIESITTLVNDRDIAGLQNPTGKDVLYNTYRNIGKSRSFSLQGYLNWNASSGTRIYGNFFGGYTYMDDGNGLRNDGWNASLYTGIQQTLPHEWRISLNTYGNTPWVSLQGSSSSYFDYGVHVSKSFLDKHLTVAAYARNFFKKYKRDEWSVESAAFIQNDWQRYTQQNFSVTVSYRFGELKASVKKAARAASNDDVKSQSGGSSE